MAFRRLGLCAEGRRVVRLASAGVAVVTAVAAVTDATATAVSDTPIRRGVRTALGGEPTVLPSSNTRGCTGGSGPVGSSVIFTGSRLTGG